MPNYFLGIILAIAFLVIMFVVFLILNSPNHKARDKLSPFELELGLRRAALLYSGNLDKLRTTILPAQQSAFSPKDPLIWMYTDKTSGTELFLSNYGDDLRVWFQPKTVLKDIHIVLDNVANNNPHSSNLFKLHLPGQHIELEGNFSKYFAVYCGQRQQIIALQIISPDIMAYLLDEALDVDIEIIEDQVAIMIRQGCESLETVRNVLDFASQFHRLVLVATKVTTL